MKVVNSANSAACQFFCSVLFCLMFTVHGIFSLQSVSHYRYCCLLSRSLFLMILSSSSSLTPLQFLFFTHRWANSKSLLSKSEEEGGRKKSICRCLSLRGDTKKVGKKCNRCDRDESRDCDCDEDNESGALWLSVFFLSATLWLMTLLVLFRECNTPLLK